MVKFGLNGSDATTAAVRLARAYTGRDLVAVCPAAPLLLDPRLVYRHHAHVCRDPGGRSLSANFNGRVPRGDAED
jgi:hypothetical protein